MQLVEHDVGAAGVERAAVEADLPRGVDAERHPVAGAGRAAGRGRELAGVVDGGAGALGERRQDGAEFGEAALAGGVWSRRAAGREAAEETQGHASR